MALQQPIIILAIVAVAPLPPNQPQVHAQTEVCDKTMGSYKFAQFQTSRSADKSLKEALSALTDSLRICVLPSFTGSISMEGKSQICFALPSLPFHSLTKSVA